MRWSQPEWPRSLPTPVVVGWATLGPLGRKMPAPGTWGSLAGLLYFTVAFAGVNVFANLILSALGAYIAVGICGEAEIRLGERDPGQIILDEVVAMPLCFLGWQALPGRWPNWVIFLAGFALFRVFDILKPPGIRQLQKLPGGWGVVADDLAAALVACAVLHGLAWWLR